jgi:hypothetical protein
MFGSQQAEDQAIADTLVIPDHPTAEWLIDP